MEGQKREVEVQEREQEHMRHDKKYRNCYSIFLEMTVSRCLEWDPNQRPSLVELLYSTKQGLAQWEAVYGSVNKPEAEIPNFAKYKYNKSADMLPIGEIAPEKWRGMNLKKRAPGVVDRVVKRPKMMHDVSLQANTPHSTPTQSPPKTGIKANVMAAVKTVFSSVFKKNGGNQADPSAPPATSAAPGPGSNAGSSGDLSELHEKIQHLHSVIGMGGKVRRIDVRPQALQPGMQPLNPGTQIVQNSSDDDYIKAEEEDNLDLYEINDHHNT